MLGAALFALAEGERMSGRLVVCPTPIGNLEDVTLRVLSALRDADVVACEDTRRTRVLLDRYGVSAQLVSYHEHNEERRAAELVERMQAGETVALVSDAGMPLVSDPGYVLVRAMRGGRARGGGAAGAERGDRRACGLGAARRPLALRGLPAAQEGRAAGAALGAGRDARGLRVAPPRAGHPGAAGRGRSQARGRRLPRADEGPRGGGSRPGRRAGRALRRCPAEGRGRARARPPPSRPPPTTSVEPTRSGGSWTQAPSRARPPRWWRS